MIKSRLINDLAEVLKKIGLEYSSDTLLYIPPKKGMGDYSSNIALQQSKKNITSDNQSPSEIAKEIVSRVQGSGCSDYLEKVEATPQGFINFFIKDDLLIENLRDEPLRSDVLKDKKVLIEYGHVNLLKEVHIGHLRTFILGEALSRIYQLCGAEVFRANYQGDIGLHIAKAVWGIKQSGWPSESLTPNEKASFLGKAYAQGSSSYNSDPNIKAEIDQINKKIYQGEGDDWSIYQLARSWSIDYLEPIYEALGIKYDHFFFESQVAEDGKQIVLENKDRVFKESEGAIVFEGEKYGLHTRVFLTNKELPTYEAKELGLAKKQYETFKYDQAIHVVANEQAGYMEVLFKVIGLIFPELEGKKTHLSYGFVDLSEGKMSSRSGNVISFNDLVSVVKEGVREIIKESKSEIDQEIVNKIVMGAIKFAYLKHSPTPNMVFDLKKSISLDGDSGPYVQYAYVRTQAILKGQNPGSLSDLSDADLSIEERDLLVRLNYFYEIVEQSAKNLRPNLICEYLVDLAHDFNLFYQKQRVLGSDQENFRLFLTQKVGHTLKTGLGLLGIEAPERM